MIHAIEKKYNITFLEVSKFECYNFIYTKQNNLEILVSLTSLKLNSKKVNSICGTLDKNLKYFQLKTKNDFNIIIAGRVKIRLIDLERSLVTTISKNLKDESAFLDAHIRQKYSLLPVPEVFNIDNNTVIEELIINENKKEYLLSCPLDTIEALESMVDSYCEYFEIRDNKYYSVIHGQIYKSDHILKNASGKIYLVDWSEGGDKDTCGKGHIFFDIVSSIKWVIFSKKFSLYTYYRYINKFINIAFQISKRINMNEWREEFIFTINLLCCKNNSFNQNNVLVKNLKKRIRKFND